VRPALQLARCSICQTDRNHPTEAHHSPAVALRIAEEAFDRGAVTDGRMWVRVARKCLKDGRR
jgi:hypothetical protein